LNAIYLSAETPSGAAGTVWRQFWESPRQITTLSIRYLVTRAVFHFAKHELTQSPAAA